MSNRIEQLAEQAGFLYDISVGLVAGPEANPHKFAELLVRECIFAVENHGGMCGVTSSNKIKEHFGVE